MTKTFLLLIFTFPMAIGFGQSNDAQLSNSSRPFILGRIEEIKSKELGELRILNIYVPEGYNPNDTTRYPVIYLLDGSANEDFIHIVGLVQFNTFDWVKRLPKSIVVGIATTDRKRDFTFPTRIEEDKKAYPSTGHSEKFISFIEKELQPFIDRKYKSNASKTIIGQSLGGLLATEILFTKPMLFDKYIIVSPSLWWDNGSILTREIKPSADKFTQKTDVYIGVGKEGLTPTTIPRVMEVDANLLFEKIMGFKNKNVHTFFDYLPQEDHGSVLHQAVANSFRLFYPADKNN